MMLGSDQDGIGNDDYEAPRGKSFLADFPRAGPRMGCAVHFFLQNGGRTI